MILSEMKKYLIRQRRVTIEDLSLHLDSDKEAVRGMLAQWIRKGRVSRTDLPAGRCGRSCPTCSCPKAPEIYEWHP